MSLQARPEDASLPQARLVAVVPAFRASTTIAQVLTDFAPCCERMIVVDDGSEDETGGRVRSLGLKNVRLITHSGNQGVGAAMKTGIKAALEEDADIVFKIDADGQMKACDLPRLLAPLWDSQADCSKGNRWFDRRALRTMPSIRRWGNLGLSFALRAASGHWKVFDPTNGYVAWRREVLEVVDWTRVEDRFLFESSMLVEIGSVGGVVQDVPIQARYEGAGSHLKVWKSLLEFPEFLLRAVLRRLWQRYFVVDFNAVSLLLVSGTLLTLFALLFGGYHWWKSSVSGVPATPGTVILSALPLLFGFNCLLQALVLDISSSNDRPLSRRPLAPQPFENPRGRS
ncbi:MAG TPA: glycosyltransferase family 2 protein [Acidobacteriota bacterium]|nr:glycosyltransferase family 2 protein [Acidobacteriota bacterium]